MADHPIRVLHCPLDVGGQPGMLAKAERQLGLKSWSVTMRQSQFLFHSDEVMQGTSESRWRTPSKRIRLLLRAIRDYDVVHFNFGRSILRNYLDLPLLKAAGKAVVVTYQGDDARQSDRCLALFDMSPFHVIAPSQRVLSRDKKCRRSIASFTRYADCIFALNPDLLHVLPEWSRFLPYASVDLRDWQPRPEPTRNAAPVVLHAPTNRDVKGTRFILEAVERLRQEGVPFDFRLVEGLPRDEARKLYAKADILIDQVLAGWYGGLAVELMAMAKPVICYIRDGDLKYLPDGFREDLPIINATPSGLYETLRHALTRPPGELAELGQRCRAFVERWHDPLTVAATTKAVYENLVGRSSDRGRKENIAAV